MRNKTVLFPPLPNPPPQGGGDLINTGSRQCVPSPRGERAREWGTQRTFQRWHNPATPKDGD